jgi:DNA-binding transcriptional LysR family regulator
MVVEESGGSNQARHHARVFLGQTMDLDLRLARHFVALTEIGHFGKAAASLHMSQSTLTKQIQTLERQVGAELIDRTYRPWRLTSAGEQTLLLCRDLNARVTRARQIASSKDKTLLTIGLQSSGSSGWPISMILLKAMEALGQPIGCAVLPITSYASALINGEIDVLISRPAPYAPDIASINVLSEARHLLIPRSWPQADAGTLTVAEAAHLPLAYNPAMLPSDNGAWALADIRPLRDANIVKSTATHFLEMLPHLIKGTAAAVVAPPVDHLLPPSLARLIDLADAPSVHTTISWRAGDRCPNVNEIIDVIANTFITWAHAQHRTKARWVPSII